MMMMIDAWFYKRKEGSFVIGTTNHIKIIQINCCEKIVKKRKEKEELF